MRPPHRRGFTLIEVLIVIAILGIIMAMMFPVFAGAREKARQVRCAANLRQMGQAFVMYAADYDDLFPYAVDFADKNAPQIWSGFPDFQAQIPFMPTVKEALQPYCKSDELWHCPSDTGFDVLEFTGVPLPTHPEAYKAYGSSYLYRTEVSFRQMQTSALLNPAATNILMDGCGAWHGGKSDPSRRYNVLFGDWHVKNINWAQMSDAWGVAVM